MTGFVRNGLVAPDDVLLSDPHREAVAALATRLQVRIAGDNRQAAGEAEIVIVAVKPNQVKRVLEEIASLMTPDRLLISVAAGVSTIFLEANLPSGAPVIRAMPNIPALVGEGMTGLSLGKHASPRDRDDAEQLFKAVGRVVTVPEANIDAVTGLSGSGPAFLAIILEALADGGVLMGLTRQVALELAVQTMLGTARVIQASGEHPAALKDRVSSPGGTTMAGLHVLEEGGLRGLLISAVAASAEKAAALEM
ncbi:MAG: pyrroline-5-carboxylate reductase [Thermacetogeniaceae bacterium]